MHVSLDLTFINSLAIIIVNLKPNWSSTGWLQATYKYKQEVVRSGAWKVTDLTANLITWKEFAH